ncbi:restriction endonuclease subunit S [Sphingobacterium siyangense]|uniref:restriction endonuclease subunit S n=1 Tax=Sphingobacterium siyangense TaxID=459529 RepID=UPI003DA4B5A1
MEMVLPKGWGSFNISLLTGYNGLFSDGDWVESKDQDPNGDVRLIQLADIGENEFKDKSNRFLNQEKADELKCTFLKKNDVLIARMPDPIGRSCIFPLSGKYATVVDIAIVRFDQKYFNPFLFSYLVNSPSIRKQMLNLASGSTRQRISRRNLDTILFPLPPLSEQERIVVKLEKLFAQHEKIKKALDHIPQLLKTFRQRVLTYAITGKLTEQWRVGKNVEEWKTEKAQYCCLKVQSGGTPKGSKFTSSGIPFLKVYNIVNNKIDFDSEPQYVSEEIHTTQIKKSIAYPGDVIMNIVGPPLNKIAILTNQYPEWNLNQAITIFRVKEYLNNRFLYYFFCEGTSVKSLGHDLRGVVGQANISLSQCRNFDIPIPPLQEQQEIVRKVESLFAKADIIEAGYQSLKAKIDNLPQVILNKAFKGELVPQLSTDGDVKDLLAEIMALNTDSQRKRGK